MKKTAIFASMMCALLSACGAGVTDQHVQPTQTAADLLDGAGQSAANSAATGPGTADSAASQVSGAATDASTEPGPEESAPQPESNADAAQPLAAAPPPPPVGATTSSPAVIYIN